jgi:3D (Asp-Asp-Asp) domain-containing protein
MILTNVIITAYCACTICCGPSASGLTASGKRPVEGVTIAASRSIPFGSRITIDGHTYTVQDRLAKRYDSRIDVYFREHKAAKKFGKKTRNIKVEL